MMDLAEGKEFFHKSSGEFAVINKAANAAGLMAHIFAMEGKTEDEKSISFVLIQRAARRPQ